MYYLKSSDKKIIFKEIFIKKYVLDVVQII